MVGATHYKYWGRAPPAPMSDGSSFYCFVDENNEVESNSLLVPLIVVSVVAGFVIIMAVILLIIAIKLQADSKGSYLCLLSVFCVECFGAFATVSLRTENFQLLDPETRISFVFARCRPVQPRCGAAGGGGSAVAVAGAILLLPPPHLLMLFIGSLMIEN